MPILQSYAEGRWHTPDTGLRTLKSAIDGREIAQTSSEGLEFAAMAKFARERGGPALRAMTFHERANMLKALAKALGEKSAEFHALSLETGATKRDGGIDIEGGFGTLFVYSSKGRRELPNARFLVDGAPELLSKGGSFVGHHIAVPKEGVAVHINAFNFPVWGMLEKLAPTLLAGMPAIVKPATPTAYLTELVFKRMIEAGVLPEGAVQLVCGSLGDLFDHLTCQDVVSFTGSASTRDALRVHPALVRNSVEFVAETDSLNAAVLGPDVTPEHPEFDLFVKEVAREMTVKAGQKCTAIRRAVVPRALASPVIEALQARLQKVVVGNPKADATTMGALAGLSQREEVETRLAQLRQSAECVAGGDGVAPVDADAATGAFLAPTLLYADKAGPDHPAHSVEAFGPVSTVIGYEGVEEAVSLARAGEGSLVASIVTGSDAVARDLVFGLAPYHGRLHVLNAASAKESTGHGSPMPHLIHGGPGRAGGGEELGGVRSLNHFLQRTALQGAPSTLTEIMDVYIPGAAEKPAPKHPFMQMFDELEIGETIHTQEREISLQDVEDFAHLTGDLFYAHMDEEAAKENPFFDGRVAHGYLVLSAAAGLFVDPAPGPVLANYGLEGLRFSKPVYPGDKIKVRLTVKEKMPRTPTHGEVRWAVEVTNQEGEACAAYDLLTMNARGGA